ncbi:MAG: dTDP-4-dehydrorhamnose reductase [Sediminibacterium sp.]|nr:dTDP-4-dehydrorhamnose reductase [Sediminibacterium sp.]
MNNKKNIVVLGFNGQLAWELQQIANVQTIHNFVFLGRDKVDMLNPTTFHQIKQYNPTYIINATAYTAVDLAENNQEEAYTINCTSVGKLSLLSKQLNAVFIHISTDYVFNGESEIAYIETDITAPINYYGLSKRDGENLALQNNPKTVVIRTSWLYSSWGKNFVKTMINLMKTKPSLQVVNDQIGSPTYCGDLAMAIIKIINQFENGNEHVGIYHFQNNGKISWYQFAQEISKNIGASIPINPVSSSEFKTPAKRPNFSLLNTQKIQLDYNIIINDWKASLKMCIEKINQI